MLSNLGNFILTLNVLLSLTIIYLSFSCLNAATNKIQAGSTSQINIDQETIILIRNIDGICKSAIYLKSNTDGVNQFLFNLSTIKNSETEKKKFQEDNETPKQVDRSEKKLK